MSLFRNFLGALSLASAALMMIAPTVAHAQRWPGQGGPSGPPPGGGQQGEPRGGPRPGGPGPGSPQQPSQPNPGWQPRPQQPSQPNPGWQPHPQQPSQPNPGWQPRPQQPSQPNPGWQPRPQPGPRPEPNPGWQPHPQQPSQPNPGWQPHPQQPSQPNPGWQPRPQQPSQPNPGWQPRPQPGPRPQPNPGWQPHPQQPSQPNPGWQPRPQPGPRPQPNPGWQPHPQQPSQPNPGWQPRPQPGPRPQPNPGWQPQPGHQYPGDFREHREGRGQDPTSIQRRTEIDQRREHARFDRDQHRDDFQRERVRCEADRQDWQRRRDVHVVRPIEVIRSNDHWAPRFGRWYDDCRRPAPVVIVTPIRYPEPLPQLPSQYWSWTQIQTVAVDMEWVTRDIYDQMADVAPQNPHQDYEQRLLTLLANLNDAATAFEDAVNNGYDYTDSLNELFYLESLLTESEQTLDGYSQAYRVADEIASLRYNVDELLWQYRQNY